MRILNGERLRLSPCLIPPSIGMLFDIWWFGGVLFSIKLLIMSSRRTLSNALVRPMKHIYAGVLNSIAFSFPCLTMNIASVVDLFLLNPCVFC